MSASLVGSEMCIRDSRRAPEGSGGPRRAPEGSGGLWRAPESCGELWRAPVSYTHLTLPTICSV
eukprot:9157598-Alexandrium_andersonii.AAC.1